MSTRDYVIGGIHPDLKQQMYEAGEAYESETGKPFSMTSGFRDNYRQSIASGFKARVGGSMHGNTPRTLGYGDGRAIDVPAGIASWIAQRGGRFGLSQPMPGVDPYHIQPGKNMSTLAAANRERLDRSLARQEHNISGSADLNVNVTAPAGTKVRAGTRGKLFSELKMNRSVARPSTPEGPSEGPAVNNGGGEE
jgi:hypothetical protein